MIQQPKDDLSFVTDTHALVWWFVDSPHITPKAIDIFVQCEAGATIIFVPSIVLAEALSIFEKKRFSFDFKRLFQQIAESENFVIIPFDYSILQKMLEIKDLPELHDKIIVATAQYLAVPLITKDKTLRSLSYIETIW